MLDSQKMEQIEEKLSNQPNNTRLNAWLRRMLSPREKLLLFNKKYWANSDGWNGL